MEQIPAEFWMIIVSAVTAAGIAIMYQMALLLKDLRATVVNATQFLERGNKILEGAEFIVEQAQGVVDNIEDIIMGILSPFEMISDLIKFLINLVNPATKVEEAPETTETPEGEK